MDPKRFDALVRTLAAPGSRRAALLRLAGIASTLGLATTPTDAAPRRRRSRSAAHQDDRVKAARRHRHRKHPCASGLTRCSLKHGKHGKHSKHGKRGKSVCVDVQTDAQNCGACGHVCAAGQTCRAGQCVAGGCTPACQDKACGQDGCGGSCGDCPPNQACRNGQCAPCVPDCQGKVCGDDGCGGSCGDCTGGKRCQQGGCVCPSATHDCGGTCQQCCAPADCPSAPCSSATCTDGVCGLSPIAGCCTGDGQCDDQNPCTVDTCVENTCQHALATEGATCGSNQVCCGGMCCASGQICQNGQCAAPCVPDCQGKVCGSDGCGGTCGECLLPKFCSGGQCTGCSQDGDCPGGPCQQGRCVIDPHTLRGRCQSTPIPGCCVSNGDCSLAPCDISVQCVSGQCVHTSACFGCNRCNPAIGDCSISICPQCQFCGAGGVCKADTAQNGRQCVGSGVCWNGECGCIPNGERCGDPGGVGGCCSLNCKVSIGGNFCSPAGT